MRAPVWQGMRWLNYLLLGAFALAGGIGLPTQAAVNVRLREVLGDPIRASFGSFLVGTVLLLSLTLLTREPVPTLATILRAPWWIWMGGALGTFYILASIIVVPRLGSAFTFALVVAGQMTASIVIDQFGLFGLPQASFSPTRIAGAALLVGGVLLIRR